MDRMPESASRRHDGQRDLFHLQQRLEVLQEAIALLVRSDDAHELLHRLSRRLGDVLDVEYYFYFANTDDRELQLVAYSGISPEQAATIRHLNVAEAICSKVAESGRAVTVDDVQHRDDGMTRFLRDIGISAYACHPLIARGSLMGTLSFATAKRPRFEDHEIELIRSVGDEVAVALERQRNSARLRQSEERLRLALDAGHMGTFEWQLDSDRVDCDDTLHKIFGREPGSVVTGRQFFDSVHPEDRSALERYIDERLRAPDGEFLEAEFRVTRPDGDVRWIAGRSRVARDARGRAYRVNGINHDITERRRAEQALRCSEARFRRLSDIGLLGVAFFRDNGEVYDANDKFLSMIEFTRDEMAQGLVRWDQLTPPEWMPRTHEALLEYRQTGRILPYEKEYLRRDGLRFWVLFGGAKLEGEAGGVAFVLDISESKRTEQALQEADRHKDDFLAALGHELRNPLAPIRNAMEILRLHGAQDVQVRWAAEVTERQVQQMTRLVDDLLDVSRINRGKIDLHQETLDLADVIAHSIEMTAPLVERRRHHLNVRVPRDAFFVRGDNERLTQVFVNLLSNAAQYTPPEGRLDVTLDGDADSVLVRLADSGIGIPSHSLKDIFEPFRQLRSHDRKQVGLGLGLALVSRLVQLHGGSVEAESAGVGAGSEFRVRLPRAIPEPPQFADAKTTAPAASGALRIVVVDDNRDVADSMAALLRLLGHDAKPVYNGVSALAAAQQFRPDLVICDIGLPDLSGHEIAMRLRQDRRTCAIRLVAVTGFGRDSDKAMQSGFDEWLLKPVDMEALEAMLAQSHIQLENAAASRHQS